MIGARIKVGLGFLLRTVDKAQTYEQQAYTKTLIICHLIGHEKDFVRSFKFAARCLRAHKILGVKSQPLMVTSKIVVETVRADKKHTGEQVVR